MKAQEYFDKYNNLWDEPEKLIDILNDFNKEAIDLIEKRKVRNDYAVATVLIQLNHKWNILASLYEEKHKVPVLVKNGFISYWSTKIDFEAYGVKI
jgi:phosphoribosyl-AMP cyclohydrolase